LRGISSASESGDSLISTSLNASPVPASIVTDVSQPARRRLLTAGLSSVGLAAVLSLDAMGINIAAASVDTTQAASTQDVTEYRGPLSLGFSFSYPSTGWSVKKKPIKTHMSEIVIANSSGRSTSSAGVTVDAVKIGKIEDFGTAEDVGKKVVAVETKKDSVLSADVLSTKVLVMDGLTYYVIEYVVESGRGRKQYVAKATITGGNLYVFTAQAKEDDLNGADGAALTTMVDSFYVKPQYL
jgi:PsbP